MDFDETRLYYSHQQLQQQQQQQGRNNSTTAAVFDDDDDDDDDGNNNNNSSTAAATEQQQEQLPTAAMRRHFREFFRNYRLGNSGYIYRNRLLKMYHRQQLSTTITNSNSNMNNTDSNGGTTAGVGGNGTTASTTHRNGARSGGTFTSSHASILVDMAHVGEYDLSLMNYLRYHPVATIPVLEYAASDALQTIIYQTNHRDTNSNQFDDTGNDDNDNNEDSMNNNTNNSNNNDNNNDNQPTTMIIPIQVLLVGNNMKYTSLRKIQSQHINRLIHCPGIVISTSPIKFRATQLTIRCSRCTDTRVISSSSASASADDNSNPGPFGSFKFPQRCMSSSTANTTTVVPNNHTNDNDDQPPAPMNINANECPMYPYTAIPDESTFIDQQIIKLQETPNHVPTGEMPRSVICTMECTLVDMAPPGTRISILCIPTLYTSYAGGGGGKGKRGGGGGGSNNEPSKSVYLRVVGIQKENGSTNGGGGMSGFTFTPAEEEAFRTLSRHADLYDILHRSIAPNIHGSYTIDIKKALCCQLFSGCRKQIHKGGNGSSMVQLRGDINVLLLGDPSMAKSQFLKFISQVAAPIGIYTSGKGSSAAGLTASVVRDAKGEFYLEGGAMVLADGGIVCIDEFDKMRPNDRVAIHEAMEQQTISIAKAGITTVLNSRSSVLAAANPVFGRYDDFKSAGENIDLMTTILSRFDMIFLVRDVREEERDRLICQHVMGVHIDHSSSRNRGSTMNGGGASAMFGGANVNGEEDSGNDPFASGTLSYDNSSEAVADHVSRIASTGYGELSVHAMKKYIQYCKMKCSPRLSEEAGDVLTSSYVRIRDDVRKQSIRNTANSGSGSNQPDSSNTVIPITVRQLEALVRISESLAKMRLDPVVRIEDVTEALRLFQVSTMTAANTSDTNHSTSPSLSNNSNAGSNSDSNTLGGFNNTNRDEIDRTESFVRSRLNLPGSSNSYMNRQKLTEECIGQGYNAMTVARVLYTMVGRGEIVEKNQGRLLKRVK